MAEIFDLDTTDANNNGTPANAGFPESMNYAQVNDAARALEGLIARWYADTNGTLLTGGSSNAYTLTPNRTIAAYAAGQEFEFEASFSNTGAATVNVSTLGAKSIKRADGTDLAADEIQAGGIYKIIYDGTNFQLVGSMSSASGRLTLSSTTTLTLAEASPVLMLGSAAGANLAFDTNSIQGRNNGAAAAMDVNALGGDLNLGAQSGTGGVKAYHDGALAFESDATGLDVRDTSGSVPTINLQSDAGVGLARLLFNAGVYLESVDHGSPLYLRGEDAGGTMRNGIVFDPDSNVTLYNAGSIAFTTNAQGINVQASSSFPLISLRDSAGTQEAQIDTSTGIRFLSLQHGEAVAAFGEDAGGTNRTLWSFDPDGAGELYFNGSKVAETQTNGLTVGNATNVSPDSSANGHLRIDGNSYDGFITLDATAMHIGHNVSSRELHLHINETVRAKFTNTLQTLLYSSTDALRTADHTAADKGTGAEVIDGGGTFRPVGMNVTPISSVSSNTDLRLANTGFQLRATAAITFDLDSTTNNAPDGSVWILTNESGSNVSITGTGVTLTNMNGAGGGTGTRTLADNGVATVTKRADGQYQIWGVGLT